jgi:hypothetical protein
MFFVLHRFVLRMRQTETILYCCEWMFVREIACLLYMNFEFYVISTSVGRRPQNSNFELLMGSKQTDVEMVLSVRVVYF